MKDKDLITIAVDHYIELLRYTTNYSINGEFREFIVKNFEVRKLGDASDLVVNEDLDAEVIIVGKKEKTVRYVRQGVYIYTYLSGAKPLSLTLEKIRDRLALVLPYEVKLIESRPAGEGQAPSSYPERIDGDLSGVGYIRHLSTMTPLSMGSANNFDIYVDDEEDRSSTYRMECNGIELPIVKRGRNILPLSLVPLGMSMYNLRKKHYIWDMVGARMFRGVSLDKDTYDKVLPLFYGDELGRDTRRCPITNARMISRKGGVSLIGLAVSAKCYLCRKYHKVEELSRDKREGYDICASCEAIPTCKLCDRKVVVDRYGHPKSILCTNCQGIDRLLDYHAPVGRKVLQEGSRFKVGIEIEKEDEKVKASLDVRKVAEDTGVVIERDGSLSREGGFEMVTPVYPLDVDFVRKSLEPIRKLVDCGVNDRCGGHVHVSDTERTPHELLQDIRGYLPLLYSLYPDRVGNEYCKARQIDSYLERGHRQALNVTDKTLEFRILPAVFNLEQLLWRIELVGHMIKNPRRDVIDVGKELFNPDAELTKILRRVLTARNLMKKAQSFIKFANNWEEDNLEENQGKVERKINDIIRGKEKKNKRFDKTVERISKDIRNRMKRDEVIRGASSEVGFGKDWGWFSRNKALCHKLSGCEDK